MGKFVAFVEQFFTALFRYSHPERRGFVALIVVTAAVLAGVALWPEASPDEVWLARVDRLDEALRTDYYRRNFASPPIAERVSTPRKPTVFIELNTADPARLTTVRGIGPVISRNIAAYRARLGGFVHKNQLREVRGVTDENFDALAAQFFIETAHIQKINLNFASPSDLRMHPYFTGSMINRIMEARDSKGGWRTLKELTDNDILLPHEAEKIAAYVAF